MAEDETPPPPEAPTEPAAPEAPKGPKPRSPVGALLGQQFRGWVSKRGFLTVLAAALIPLILSGAWVFTHQSDVAMTDLGWDEAQPTLGRPMNFTATFVNKGGNPVGAFNVTIRVGTVVEVADSRTGEVTLRSRWFQENETKVDGLEPGQSGTALLSWTPVVLRTADRFDVGTIQVQADADSRDVLGEIEEFNNRKERAFQVQVDPAQTRGTVPPPPNLAGGPNATAQSDLLVENLTYAPRDINPGGNLTFTATVRNAGTTRVADARFELRVGNLVSFSPVPLQNTTRTVTLEPGAAETLQLAWQVPPAPNQPDKRVVYWFDAAVAATSTVNDTNVENNHDAQVFFSDRKLVFEEPPERATVRAFYIAIMRSLHLTILIPFIGIFYAAGVLADERERGNLIYLLTRPIGRWLIPITRFFSSFLVAALAISVGTAGSFLLFFGLGQGDGSYLVAPLLMSLLSLFVYGAFFILLGVFVERPYLVAVAFVIGWEAIAGNFVPWVKNVTINHHLTTAIASWTHTDALPWPPPAGAALDAARNLLIAGIVFLAVAAYTMKRREFNE